MGDAGKRASVWGWWVVAGPMCMYAFEKQEGEAADECMPMEEGCAWELTDEGPLTEAIQLLGEVCREKSYGGGCR